MAHLLPVASDCAAADTDNMRLFLLLTAEAGEAHADVENFVTALLV